MAKQLNVNLAFNADTSKASQQIKQLEAELGKLVMQANSKQGLALDDEIKSAVNSANQLRAILEKTTTTTGKLDLSAFNNEFIVLSCFVIII